MRLLIAAAAVGLLAGCDSEAASEVRSLPAKTKPESKPALVELATVVRGQIEEVLERSAPLDAEAHVQVQARTQNPAVELLVEEGDKVAEGQVLLRLENDRQKTDYEQSQIQLEQARVEFHQQQKLYDQNLISDTEYRTAKFAFDQAELQAQNARRELEYTEVRAPIDGTITERMVKTGDQVVAGTALFKIVDLDSTVAVINVPEQYLPKLQTKMQARLISGTLGDRAFAGSVKRISPVVDARAGTIKVVVEVKDLGPLRPGMWVDVELVLSSKPDALLIPKRAIVYDNDQTYAFKTFTGEDGVLRAKRELVVPLNVDKEHVEPAKGFEVGDRIVVAGHSGLKDESPIREVEDPDEAGSKPSHSVAQTEEDSAPARGAPPQSGSSP